MLKQMTVLQTTLRAAVLEHIKANPGCKGGAICVAMGKRGCDRDVDRAQQALRRSGLIAYRKVDGGGWFATEKTETNDAQ